MNRSGGTSLRMFGWLICLTGCANYPLHAPALQDESLAPAIAASGGIKKSSLPSGPLKTDQPGTASSGADVAGAPSPLATGDRSSAPQVDPQDMPAVLAELEALGAIDVPTRDRLVADLKKTDPALWPQLLSYFKASLAYRQKYVGGGAVAQDSEEPAVLAAAPVARPSMAARATDEPELLPHAPSSKRALAALSTAAANAATDVGSLAPAVAPSAANPRDTAMTDRAVQPAAYQIATPSVEETASAATGAASLSASASAATASSGGTSLATIPPAVGEATPGATAPAAAQAPPASQTPAATTVASAGTKPGSPAPAAGIDPLDWHAHLKAAIRVLERETADPPATTSAIGRHAGLRMLYLVDGDRDGALRAISGISATQQDFWSQQLFGLSNYLDAERTPDDARRAAAAAVHLRDANLKLGDLATLSVRNLAFATEVSSYGVYKKFERYEFHAGQEVLLYAEVENFKSAATDQGFHTALRSSYQILDNRGARVDQKEFEITEEHCQNPRRDYFIRYFVWMPKRIYGGTYTLQLTIEDTLSQKIGQALIEFTVADKE